MIRGRFASDPLALLLAEGLAAKGEIDSTSSSFPLLAIILRRCSCCLVRLRDRRQRIAHARSAAPIPPAKIIVTMRPDVVRLLSSFLQLSAPAVGEKQSIPGAQVCMAVVVGVHVTVVPSLIEHADVDFIFVT